MKTCSNPECKENNPQSLINFNKKKENKDGLQTYCKFCDRIKGRLKYSLHRDKKKIQGKASYLRYREARLKKMKERYHADPKLFLDRSKENRKINSKYRAAYLLNRKYSIKQEQFIELKNKQNNVCAICKKEEITFDKRANKVRELSVDHCHVTGKIRGLLCGNCNKGIGNLKDSIEILNNAINYLKENNGRT